MNEQQRKELEELKTKYAQGNIPASELPEWVVDQLIDHTSQYGVDDVYFVGGGYTTCMPSDMVKAILDAEIPEEAAQYDHEVDNDGDILKAVHETAKGLHKSGAINKTTMRKFDSLCLTTIKKYSPRQINLASGETIITSDLIVLTTAGADTIMNALDNPSPPTEAALKAAKQYREDVKK